MKTFCAGIGAVSLAILALPVQGANFYSGKIIRFSVGASAAGGFTLVTRVLAEHFKKHIPGHPNMLVELKPGTGGGKSMDYILNAVAKDGTFIGAVLPPAVIAPLLRKVRYDSTKAAWVGSVTPMPEVNSVWHTAPAKTLDEAKKIQLVMATSSKLSSAYLIPAFLNATVGTKFKMVQGYRGGGPMNKAMVTGEVNGRASFYNSYRTTKAHWLRDKKIFHLVQVGPNIKEIFGVPNLRDVVKTDEQRRMVDFLEVSAQIGHGFFVSGDVPADRVKILRTAFDATMRDPAFLADAKKRR
ncbi:MAG: tripartite tricarboxylate transporter substrate-binding protein, partial [Pseudomonadota bacterium]|nr:tripartite tricarboxylate transporter substrate-binding protein [Pseudomonadota bacterium]